MGSDDTSSKVWFITGTASGFGRLMTEYALDKGHKVVATLLDPIDLRQLQSKYPSTRLLVLKLDVIIPAEISHAFLKAKEAFGRIDVVFNNAGRNLVGEIEGTPEKIAREIFDINFWGANNVSVEAVKFFREVNGPSIGGCLLVLTSSAAYMSATAMGFYSASKSALERTSEALALELDPKWNIKISLIEPSRFATSIGTNTVLVPLHPAYKDPKLRGHSIRHALDDPHNVPRSSDPLEGIKLIYKLTELDNPPMHFPLGRDAVLGLRSRNRRSNAELEQYGPWSDVFPKL